MTPKNREVDRPDNVTIYGGTDKLPGWEPCGVCQDSVRDERNRGLTGGTQVLAPHGSSRALRASNKES